MKKGKLVLVALIIIGLIIGAVLFFGKDKNKKESSKTEQITIDFDTDGGSKVESIKINKNSSITLPATTKEGYNFIGWYNDATMVTNETKFSSNTKLVAKWDKIPDDVKTFTIVFDTKGGSEINGLTLECNKEIKLPPKPTKKGFTFVSWQDNNGKVINDGALLACEDITLTAVWKEDKKEDDSNSNSNKKEIVYVCDKDYTLDGKTCKKTVDAERKCPDGTFEYEGVCLTVTASSRRESIRKCGTKIINTGGGHTPTVEGTLLGDPKAYYACYYKLVEDPYEQQNRDNCTTRSHKWSPFNNKCYYDADGPSQNMTFSCASKEYVYISNPNQFSGVNGMNSGCFPKTNKVSYCKEGELNSGKCNIEVAAKKTEK